MHRLTVRATARWPIIRGRRRRAAHRPLPSMMTARWRGRVMGWWPGLGIRDWGVGKAEASGFPKWCRQDRKSVVEGKSVLVRVDVGGRRFIIKKNKTNSKK